MSNVAAAAFAPFISAAGAEHVRLRQLDRTGQAARSREDLRDAGIHQVAQLPRQRGLALRHPGDAARRSPACPTARPPSRSTSSTTRKRRTTTAGAAKSMQHDDYCWMNAAYVDGHAADRRLRQVRLLHRDPRRRGRRQGREPAVPRVHLRRRRPGRQVPDRDRHHRPARVRAVQPRLPAALPLQEHRLRGVLRRARRCRSRRSTTGPRRRPTRRSRRACPTSWRPAGSPTT